ncbi:MAG: translocation/assembly module TamB domain-containing protein [Bryobacteraceae bacterium]
MKRKLWRIAAVLAALLSLAVVAGVFVLRSAWFLDYLRQSIIEQAQRATGAKVEIGGLYFDWTTLRARVDNFVLHGKEPAGEAPLLQLQSATLGFKIISVFEKKVDLLSLRVDSPQIRVIVYPDGSTNIPGVKSPPDRLWTQDLLNMKIGEYEIANGTLEYDERRIPLNFHGQNLNLKMTYDAATPSYGGQFSSDAVRITPPGYDPVDTAVNTDFVLEQNRVRITRLHWTSQGATADVSGTLDDLRSPHGTLAVRGSSPLRDLVREFRLPIDPAGKASFNGNVTVSFGSKFEYSASGQVAAQGLHYAQDLIKIENADLNANAQVSTAGAIFDKVTAHALGATVTGDARLDAWKDFQFAGQINGLDLRRTAGMVTAKAIPWNGTLAGTFSTRTTLQQANTVASANLEITPAGDGDPITGHVEVIYDQAKGTVALGSSSVATSATRVELDGTLGKTLRVRARTTRLEDVLPALELATNGPVDLPLKLNNGSVSLDGNITGRLDDPQFHGQVAIANGQVREYRFDRFSADLDVNRREVLARNLEAARGRTTASGTLALTERPGDSGSFANSEMVGQLTLRNVDLAQTAREGGLTQPVSGIASATVRLSGSFERPEATVALDVQNPVFEGEKADRVRTSLRYVPGTLELTDGIVNDGASEVRFSGTYKHPLASWRSGDATFEVTTQNLPTARLEKVVAIAPNISGILGGRIIGSGTINQSNSTPFTLTSATANVSARQIVVDGLNVGEATFNAQTKGNDLTLTATGTLRESRIDATGAWKLEGDSPGSAKISFSRISIDSLQALMKAPASSVDGFIDGEATVNVALQKPRDFRAEVRLANVQASPKQNPAPRLGLKPEDVILRNSQPVVLEVTSQSANVRAARFTGRNTQMDVAGVVPFNAQTGADLTVRGNIDLTILQLLRSDLQAVGTATVNATIRGSLQNPNLNGQLTFSGAKLYLADLPNGADNASGTILFDRTRATVQQLTAETGGGQVTFTGFVEFGNALVYRLQARARRVRVRYPQDVSTTFDADLSLNGTSEASTLSGAVTLSRTAFTVSTDLGQVLAQSTQPTVALNAEDDYLTGMQLDVRITNSANFQLETSLASGVEAEVDLRLRGSPSRPVLSGSASINRGLVQVFGNQYTLERGDIRFLNPVKIEPTIDMDLSTRARGVTVNISLSGTLDKISPNWSSDPPLLPSEIIALLAVGRDPSLASSQSAPSIGGNSTNSAMGAGGNILGQALSAQVSNKVQRFFGASRVKIDPTLTGVDNIPQARLTLEQQVSKDITLTYITNLNRTQEQIVRMQWDLSRDWSAIAVRDPTGLFSVDFQFRKRFK